MQCTTRGGVSSSSRITVSPQDPPLPLEHPQHLCTSGRAGAGRGARAACPALATTAAALRAGVLPHRRAGTASLQPRRVGAPARGGAEPAKRRAWGGAGRGAARGLSLGCASCQPPAVPRALGAAVPRLLLFASSQKQDLRTRGLGEPGREASATASQPCPLAGAELLAFHRSATAAAWMLLLHAKANPPMCAARSVDRSIPRAACASPGNIFNLCPKSQLSTSSMHRPHLNIFLPGGVGHARNVSEPALGA